jgi:hypothetical protein
MTVFVRKRSEGKPFYGGYFIYDEGMNQLPWYSVRSDENGNLIVVYRDYQLVSDIGPGKIVEI